MTDSERFDQIFERIERAKKHPAFKEHYWFGLRVILAENQLGLGHLDVAEKAITNAENLLLAEEIREMALKGPRGKIADILSLVQQKQFDQALAIVLS